MNSSAEIVLQQGKYRIKHTLDRGEFGITYRATHVPLGQAVAIKTLRPSLRHHPDFSQYYHHFRAVTHRLSQCQHPNLIRVLDLFEEKGLPFIVMNYIEGSSLAEKLQSRSPLSVDQALYYIRQVAAALKVIHQYGLLHCNIQPHTILQRAGSDEVTLIDFGINSSFSERTTQPYRGNRNLPGGFAALEQYLPHETLTQATDVYGLAATLYYLLTRQPPIDAPLLSSQGTAQWFSSIQPSLKRLHPELSPSIEQMILAGLEVKSSNRPQTLDRWLALMPNLNSNYPPVESPLSPEDREHSTRPDGKAVSPTSSQMSPPRFLGQLLWLQRYTPIVFIMTALLFGWLGFSLTRRYTQMVFHDVHQRFDSDQKGLDWSGEGFSDYDPSRPMFEDPSVKTKVVEPEEDPWASDRDLDFDQADNIDSDDYNSDEDWNSQWDQNDRLDDLQRQVSEDAYSQPYSQGYQTRPEDEYDWESDNSEVTPDNTPDYTNEWETTEANTWESESNSQPDEGGESDPYDYNYQYNYDREARPNRGTSGYSGYTTDLSNDNSYDSGYGAASGWEETESNPSTVSEYDTDWNSTPTESYNPSPTQTPSSWTPEPTMESESSSQWRSSSEEYNYNRDSVVELSISGPSQSFSEFETDSTLSSSSLELEEF